MKVTVIDPTPQPVFAAVADEITTGVAEHAFERGWNPVAFELSVPLINHGEYVTGP